MLKHSLEQWSLGWSLHQWRLIQLNIYNICMKVNSQHFILLPWPNLQCFVLKPRKIQLLANKHLNLIFQPAMWPIRVTYVALRSKMGLTLYFVQERETSRTEYLIKGATCKNWSAVWFTLQTNWGQHITCCKCSCSYWVSSVSCAVSRPGWLEAQSRRFWHIAPFTCHL